MAAGEREATDVALASGSAAPAVIDTESDTPKIETNAYRNSKPRWKKCRDLMIGTEAIRAGGIEYLPQHPHESPSRYNIRRVIAALFNAYKRTVQAAVGIILYEEPVLGDDMPKRLVRRWENIDGNGTHGAVFTRHLLTAGIVDGFAGILTEYPRKDDPNIDRSKASLAATVALETGAPLDAADEEALGLDPYFILVKADQVLLALYETINGKRTLVLLILQQTSTERKGKYGLKSVVRYRTYQLINRKVYYERWTETDGAPKIDQGPSLMQNLIGIPFSPMAPGEEISDGEYLPTMMDLAELNIENHNIKTGILSLEALAFVPTPVRVGATPQRADDGTLTYPEIILGPSHTIEAPATQGVNTPFYWTTPPTDVLDPGMKSLESNKTEMGAMGASFLAPQKQQPETATAERMDASAERANVSTLSRAAKDCLESAFGFAGQYIKEPGGSVTMNDDFTGEGIDPQYLAVIVSAYQQGGLTLEELRYVLQTGQLPEDFDATDVAQLMADAKAKADQMRLDAQARLKSPTPGAGQ